jgi:hypothetical protein
MKIHEITDEHGEYSGVHLRVVGDGVLEIADAQGALLVPPGALEKVLERYGAPFDSEAPISVVRATIWCSTSPRGSPCAVSGPPSLPPCSI